MTHARRDGWIMRRAAHLVGRPRAVAPPSVIELDPAERAADAARHVARTRARTVVIVVPWSRRWSEAEFELLARRAAGLQRAVVVVSRDPAARAAATASGLAAVAAVADATHPGRTWPIPQARATAARREILKRRPPLPPARLRIYRRPWPIAVAFVALAALLSALALVGLVLLALPSGVVTLRPAQGTVEAAFDVFARAGAKLDPAAGMIPARPLDVTVEAKGEATPRGYREEPDGRAAGVVVFLNRQPEPVLIPGGTVVETSAGPRVRFRTTQGATLAGVAGASARVPIMAVDAGPVGNVPAYAINTVEPSLALVAGVINDVATTGGSMRREPVVTAADRQDLRNDLEGRLRVEALSGLRAQVAPGERLAADGVRYSVVAERFDADPARPSVTTLWLRLKATGLGYDPTLAGAVAAEQLARRVPPGFRVLPDSTEFVASPSERVVAAEGAPTVVLGVRAMGRTEAVIDRAAVRGQVSGRELDTARHILAAGWPLAEPPWVNVGPAWVRSRWHRLPWLPLRIDVVVLGHDG